MYIRATSGPDWQWSNQDGGKGSLGTVLEAEQGWDKKLMRVKWRVTGKAFYYRFGRQGKYDVIAAEVMDRISTVVLYIFRCSLNCLFFFR